MGINVWGYLKEYNDTREEILEAVSEVFESGKLILGPKVSAFEQAYSQYIGTQFGVGCDNGTNALFLSLKALNIGSGDEVITVANTAIPTVSAIVSTGATPVFVDIDSRTYLMDVAKLENAISDKTKAVLPVHLYGQCVDMNPLLEIASRHHLPVIEDCAQAHGAEYKGKKAGSMGTISATSFYPTKVLGAYGDGGMMNTSDAHLAERMKRLRFYGTEGSYFAHEQGFNSRLDEVQAAILLTKLNHINEYVERRREIAHLYNEQLSGTSLTLPYETPYGRHSYYLYVVRHQSRDEIINKLKEFDIHLNISYPWPIHQMPAYKDISRISGSLAETERISHEIFSLPMYPSLTNDEVSYVCDNLKKILKEIE